MVNVAVRTFAYAAECLLRQEKREFLWLGRDVRSVDGDLVDLCLPLLLLPTYMELQAPSN